MILIDIASPVGALTQSDRDLFADHLLPVILSDDHAPEETMRRARKLTHLRFSEQNDWHTGDGPVRAGQAPPLIITATVPEAWREEISRHLVGALRSAVRRIDTAHGRRRDFGELLINVVGIADGSIGLNGKACTAAQLLEEMTADYRAAVANGVQRPVPDGMLVDPICGMLVRPGPGAIVVDRSGAEQLGFCSEGCREAYLAQAR